MTLAASSSDTRTRPRAAGSARSQYYKAGAFCKPCASGSGVGAMVAVGIVGVVILCGFCVVIAKGVETTFFVIALNFFQVISIIAEFGLDWPDAVRSLMHAVSFANFNIYLTQPECTVPTFNWIMRYFCVLALPLIVG